MATTAADLAAGAIAMVAKARYTYEHLNVFGNTVTVMRMGQGEKSIYIPKFGTVVTQDLIDGVDMANDQKLTITGTTHVTAEAGCKVIVTKRLRNQLKEPAFRAAGIVIGNSMGKKMEEDGLTLYSGLDSGLGSGTTTMSLGILAASITQCLGQAEPVPPPMAVVLHPYTLNALVDLIATPSSTNHMPPGYQESVLREHFAGIDKLYGLPIFRSGRISIDTNDDAYGAVYSKLAFIHVVGWEPDNWIVYDDSLRGWEIGIVSDYAMVEEDGTYGRYLFYDATAPTS